MQYAWGSCSFEPLVKVYWFTTFLEHLAVGGKRRIRKTGMNDKEYGDNLSKGSLNIIHEMIAQDPSFSPIPIYRFIKYPYTIVLALIFSKISDNTITQKKIGEIRVTQE